eukprot:TRINITY_DN2454_c0_g2_i5.p2 TRINITY_DN2454_c0_g2~~TRINITY_DN2454_c0_g2_i5.p2  ORF type:complete len:126 (-),score=49.96 TRINITY_DN2454_c0_g2_i5:752-1093(-)
MIRRPPRSTHCISSAASDVYKRQILPGDDESVENFKKSFEEINSIYQEYFFGRFVGDFNPHFVKPLLLDYTIEVASHGGANSCMYIEVLFEHGGISLDNLDSISIEMAYNLMR